MKNSPIFVLSMLGAVLSAGLPTTLVAQQSAAPKAQAAAGPSEELKALVAGIDDKLAGGQKTEADYTVEFGKFDALLARYSAQKTDDVAEILVYKAMLYVQVFEDYGKGVAVLKQLKADFPTTKPGQQADAIISKIELQMEASKVADALKPGAEFPVFDEQDMQGKPLKLESYRGHVVLVDFWATWCGPCVAEFPNVLAAYQKYHSKGFDIVGISLDEDRDALNAFIKDKKVTWPQYFDGKGWESKLGTRYGVVSIPTSYLLDPQGKIVAVGLRGAELDAKLASLLSK
jgi:thiol-disulfide isomerase/thioredoxin